MNSFSQTPKNKGLDQIIKKNNKEELKNSINKNLPEFVKPMLCKSKDTIFEHPDWIFEYKFDGFRAIARVENGKCNIYNRNKLSIENKFKEIKTNLESINENIILDGEIAVEDEKGITKFQLLQNLTNNQTKPKFFVFDILFLNGYNLMELPLIFRKEILSSIFFNKKINNIEISPHIRNNGKYFFHETHKKGAEGIIAKYALGIYSAGHRSNEWLKIKNLHEQEAVIVGYTQPNGERNYFGSIIFAVKENKNWKYIGNCGTGFSYKMVENLFKEFQNILSDHSPFKIPLKLESKIQWLKPKLVCQVKFKEWTTDYLMRQPIFLGIRKDKKPSEVMIEKND